MLFLTAETGCKTCRVTIFLQRLDGSVFCHGCGELTPLEPDFAARVVRAALALGRSMADGGTSTENVSGFLLLVRRAPPACPSCTAPIHGISEFCAKCGYPNRPRNVVGATVLGEASAPAPPRPGTGSAGVESFQCRQCGSPMSLEGMPASIPCPFCQTVNHIPRAFYYRGHSATARRLALEPAQALDARPQQMPTELLAAVDVRRIEWQLFPQPDGEAVLTTEDAIFRVDASLNLRWVRKGVKAKGFPGPSLNEKWFLSGPGVIAWCEGKVLRRVNVATGEDLEAIPFPELWRDLFRNPSVYLADGPIYAKGGSIWRWKDNAFVREPEQKSLAKASSFVGAGDEVWMATASDGEVVMSRHAADLSLIKSVTAPALPGSAKWAFAFAGESCGMLVGKGVSLAKPGEARVQEVFRIANSKSRLIAFGDLGFTFLGEGGAIARFDLAGTPTFTSKADAPE